MKTITRPVGERHPITAEGDPFVKILLHRRERDIGDYFADPYKPKITLEDIHPNEADDAVKWLLLRGYTMVKGAIVEETELEEPETKMNLDQLAKQLFASSTCVDVEGILCDSVVVGPYVELTTDGEPCSVVNGIGLWALAAKRARVEELLQD